MEPVKTEQPEIAELPEAQIVPEAQVTPDTGTGGKRVARNVAAVAATQLITWALTAVVALYLPRYVGDTGLGKLAFASSFVVLFSVVIPLGIDTVLVREIARDRERTGELLLTALALRLPLCAVSALSAYGLATLLGYSVETRQIILGAALGIAVSSINDPLTAALQGQERLPRSSAASLAERTASAGLTIALIMSHAPLWTVAAVGGVTSLISLGINLTAFRALLPEIRQRTWKPRMETIRFLVLSGLPFLGWTVSRAFYGQTDPLVLGLITNDATVGWYAAAFRLIGTTLFIPNALVSALLPTMSRYYHEDKEKFERLTRQVFSLVLICGVPITLVLAFLPEQVLGLLHYQSGFNACIPVLRVGSVSVLLYFVGMVLGTAVIASNGEKKMASASMGAALIGVPACFLGSYLTHRYLGNGAIGAMASDVFLEACLVVVYLRALNFRLINRAALSQAFRCALAAVPMAALLYVFSRQGMHGAWVVLPCTVLYLVACLILGAVDAEYIAMARTQIVRVTRRLIGRQTVQA
jgi:O-antigen/teichoic acid export membrane protein